MRHEIIQSVAYDDYDDYDDYYDFQHKSTWYFHKISFYYFEDYLMTKLNLR
jgi:hypothetical protein